MNLLDSLRQDVSYASRRLWQSPGYTLVATLTLALGIGATSAIFSIVNAVLLRPLPFPQAEQLVEVAQLWKGKPAVYSPQNFLDVEAQAKSFERLAAIDQSGVTLTGHGAATRLEGAEVSASFFDVMRERPVLGRGFVAGENQPGTRIVVLGHKLWLERFGGDEGLVGRTVQIDREPRTVVGIAPPGFSYPEATEIWLPMTYDERFRTNSRGAWYLSVVGRLAPGASLASAREEVRTIAARLEKAYPDANEGVGGTVRTLHEATVGDARRALLVLLGAVGLVLLVACVNVANLLLARIAGRESELALRAALGAGRGRIVRQLFTESLLLALAGGGAGVLLASVLVDGLLALQPQGVPRLAEVHVDRGGAGVRRDPVAADERRVRRAARASDGPQGGGPVAAAGQPRHPGRRAAGAARRARGRSDRAGDGAARRLGPADPQLQPAAARGPGLRREERAHVPRLAA